LVDSLIELGKFQDCRNIIDIGEANNFFTKDEVRSFKEKCSRSEDPKEG